MRVLTTGGAGFTGSHPSAADISGGDEVCDVDSVSTGSIEPIERLKHSRVHSVNDSFQSPLATTEEVSRRGVSFPLGS